MTKTNTAKNELPIADQFSEKTKFVDRSENSAIDYLNLVSSNNLIEFFDMTEEQKFFETK